jgi:glycosyltransferase involved in cell wall biosynthesis
MSNYVVYTGNFSPHKNVKTLITACDQIKLQLILIGSKSPFYDRLPQSPVVTLKSGLDDQVVKKIYKEALCYVTPSLYEGFGLTGLEAMAAGCPVVAANNSCLPEIYGDAALYFDPNSVTDLINKLKLILVDTDLRLKLIKLGGQQVKQYTWELAAQKTWQEYISVLP